LIQPLSREIEIEPAHTALLFVDVQKYSCCWEGGEYAQLSAAEKEAQYGYFFRELKERALPNMVLLQQACRDGGIYLDREHDGGGAGSTDAQMVDELAPAQDEIVFPKTSSSVFISTNIDNVLRNLGTKYLIIAGCLTDQCVDSAVRDACVTLSAERHESSLRNNRGYCRQRTTREVLSEITRLTRGR
jgi:ureidoacrylate peracid hydrolase